MSDDTDHRETKPTISWFQKIPRKFFRYPKWIFSVYFGFGYLVTGILHYRIWKHSPQVETIFTNLGLTDIRPKPLVALVLFGITSPFAVITMHKLLTRVNDEGGNLELVFWGTAVSMIYSWIPWLYASSIVTTIFIFLYGMNAIAGYGITRFFLRSDQTSTAETKTDPWKMFVHATKASAALVAILLGAVATSTLFPWRNSEVEPFEILRYALLCAYVVLGILGFILMPLLSRSLAQGPHEEVAFEPPGPL